MSFFIWWILISWLRCYLLNSATNGLCFCLTACCFDALWVLWRPLVEGTRNQKGSSAAFFQLHRDSAVRHTVTRVNADKRGENGSFWSGTVPVMHPDPEELPIPLQWFVNKPEPKWETRWWGQVSDYLLWRLKVAAELIKAPPGNKNQRRNSIQWQINDFKERYDSSPTRFLSFKCRQYEFLMGKRAESVSADSHCLISD